MSRVAKSPVTIPSGVNVLCEGRRLSAKGKNGALDLDIHPDVTVSQAEGQLTFAPIRPAHGPRRIVYRPALGRIPGNRPRSHSG